MKDYQDLCGFAELQSTGMLIALERALSDLLNCKVQLQCKMSSFLPNVGYYEKPKRTTYQLSPTTVLTISRVIDNGKLLALFGVKYEGQTVALVPSKVFNAIANTLTNVLSDQYTNKNRDAIVEIGDQLLIGIIASTIGKGSFNHFRLEFLIQYFLKIKALKFEGRDIQTGIILTRSVYAFKKQQRDGRLTDSSLQIDLIRDRDLNKRNWYLIDGKNSYHVFDQTFQSKGIFTINYISRPHSSFIDYYLMSGVLKGMDILLRIINPNQLSIVASNQVEFINIEGVWHVRNYSKLTSTLCDVAAMSEEIAKTLLFFIIQLSQKGQSSIMFVPAANSDDHASCFNFMGINVLGPISISDKMFTNTLFRILSSDGVTIIRNDGTLSCHGCIVKLPPALPSKGKLQGTGNAATQELGKFGTAIKISSDGTITIANTMKNIQIKF